MKTYSIEEIERMLEGDYLRSGLTSEDVFLKVPAIIRQLLAERSQIRKQAFEEAAELAQKYEDECFLPGDPCPDFDKAECFERSIGYCIANALRRKAEEGK